MRHALFEQNEKWASRMLEKDPNFFKRLHKEQKPKYLWIGCSDSRASANQIVDLAPGEIFVHRNIANVVVHTDLNCLSVIQYAVEVLKVEHIIICGHYGCGGVKAAIESKELGLIDNWLRHIQDVYRSHKKEIEKLPHANDRYRLLCEKNVIEQAVNVSHTTIAQKAWHRDRPLSIHGWIYSIKNGLLHDLGVCISRPKDINNVCKKHGIKHL